MACYEELVLLELKEVSRFLKIEINDILEFLKIRGYAKKHEELADKWFATAMGVELGYVKNELWPTDDAEYPIRFFITQKGFYKIEKAFNFGKLSPEQEERVNALCKEAEKNMKSSSMGKAE